MNQVKKIIKKKFKFRNKNVLYLKKNSSKLLDSLDLIFLNKLKNDNNQKSARICLHPNESSKIHQMLIYQGKNKPTIPHKHLDKDESLYLLKGKLDIIFFDKVLEITNIIKLNEFGNKGIFYCDIPKNIFHTSIYYQDCIFLEISKGPFIKKNMIKVNKYKSYDQKKYFNILQKKIREYNES